MNRWPYGILLIYLSFLLIGCSTKVVDDNPLHGEWEMPMPDGGGKHLIRIDETYFQEFYKEGSDSSNWTCTTQYYKVGHDTLSTFDLNHKIKKLYAWNAWVIISNNGEQMKLRTISKDIITWNRVHSGFTKVDTTLDRRLAGY